MLAITFVLCTNSIVEEIGIETRYNGKTRVIGALDTDSMLKSDVVSGNLWC